MGGNYLFFYLIKFKKALRNSNIYSKITINGSLL
jgi:hypothetical protein